jgi:hypothetical protein
MEVQVHQVNITRNESYTTAYVIQYPYLEVGDHHGSASHNLISVYESYLKL